MRERIKIIEQLLNICTKVNKLNKINSKINLQKGIISFLRCDFMYPSNYTIELFPLIILIRWQYKYYEILLTDHSSGIK